MANVGYATLQIIPSVRGIGNELRRQLVAPAGDAGGAAGEESGSRFSDAWKTGLAAAGAVAGAVLVSATVSAVAKEKMADRLAAQLGLSGKGAKQAGKVAGSLYSNAVVETFEDGAATVRAVMASGLIPEKATTRSIEAITTKVADLASTFGQDLTGTANAAAQMIRTGLAKNGVEALDLLTTGFQSSADKAGDFVDTINEYGTQFRKAGLDGASAIGLMNQAIGAGARDADVAADAIKEFGIRAVDGSKSSADGFKALGLSADDMGARFAQGGSSANAVLDLTLDKLRGIKDPVKQSQTAVALFGTQAEDLGAALFAMDPSTAAAGLDKVGGAAKRVGDTIRGNTATELTVLQRKFTGVLGRVVTAVVLPGLRGLNDVLAWVGDAVASTGRWFQRWGAWLIPVGVLVAGLTVLLSANAIATGVVTAVFSVYRGAILAWAAVQRTAIVVQTAWNTVMALNPIGLVVIALIALGAALVVAYKKSDTFRGIVQGAWNGIKTAAVAAWDFIKPAIDGFMVGLRAVGTAAAWLWTTVLSPVFGFISTAARILATVVVVLVLLPIIAAVKLVGAIVSWLWDVAIGPAFRAIGAAGLWLWNSALKPAFNNLMTGLRAVGSAAMWLWTNAIRPALGWIADKAVWLWQQKIKPAFDLLKIGIGLVGTKIRDLWNTYAKPIFQFIGDKATWLWEKALKPSFDLGKKGVSALGDAFGKAKDAIKSAWDKLEGITKKPISFLINTVYNGGIVPVWNKVASAFGAPKLDKVKGFAVGGPVHGAGTETSDDVPAWLSRNEHVWTAKEVRGAGGHGAVMAMRNWAAAGGGAGAPGFAKGGGLFGWVKGAASKGVDFAKSGVDWLKDGVKASARAGLNSIVRPLIDKISGSASLYRDMVKGIPTKMLSSIFDYSGKADTKLEAAGIGGKGYRSGLSWARTQHGLPYQWGGNGDPSWDCSGFLSAIESKIRGQKPHRRWATGAFSGTSAPAGWVLGARSPYMIGITNSGVGHTAGTINGVNVESRGGDGVIVGSRARSYMDPLFTHRYGLKYDRGGWLMPGDTMAVNRTGQPEAILTGPQWQAMSALAAAAKAAASRPATAATRSERASLEGMSVSVFVGSEEISRLARAEVRAANGELVAVLNAGGGN